MILYFSGTGNSAWVAHLLAEATNDTPIDIATHIRHNTVPKGIEKATCVGIVFPIHSWYASRPVVHFLKKLPVSSTAYRYAVCTCGDDAGKAINRLKRHFKLNAAWSVQMPNTYIPMFELDDNETARAKVTDTQNRISQIANDILSKKTIWQVKEGAWPRLKTYVVNPLFVHFCIRTKSFHTDEGCISCGLCVSACPLGNIHLQNGRPQWGTECVHCMACLHACPRSVIQYGHSTQKRGRYSLKDFL